MTAEDDTYVDAITAEVSVFPPLSVAEVAPLLADAQRTPRGPAQERLVEHHLSVALAAALERRDKGIELPDLYQEGVLAVTLAISEYSARHGSAPELRGYVARVVAAHLDDVVVQQAALHDSEMAFVRAAEDLDAAVLRLRQELGHTPNPSEVARILEWPVSQVRLVHGMLLAARAIWDEDIALYLDDSASSSGGAPT